jgi:hypothetical protein
MRREWEYLMEKHEGNGQLGRPRLRRDDNIKMDFSGSRMWRCGLDRCGS